MVTAWSSAKPNQNKIKVEPPELTLSAYQQNTALSYLQLFLKEKKTTLSTASWRRSAQHLFNETYNIIAE